MRADWRESGLFCNGFPLGLPNWSWSQQLGNPQVTRIGHFHRKIIFLYFMGKKRITLDGREIEDSQAPFSHPLSRLPFGFN